MYVVTRNAKASNTHTHTFNRVYRMQINLNLDNNLSKK